jgi:murein DD-endopeptidase MepM/ murein hydrolase activator NlpD
MTLPSAADCHTARLPINKGGRSVARTDAGKWRIVTLLVGVSMSGCKLDPTAGQQQRTQSRSDHDLRSSSERPEGKSPRRGFLALYSGSTRVAPPAGLLQADAGSSGLRIPVVGVRPSQLVDTFAQARAQGARRHDAIDILSPDGTPVVAATAGRVEKLFASHDGGNTIYVRSSDRRMIYYYAHLSAYARGLREGLAIKAGQFLGTVGHSGNASPEAPHLHFAMWVANPAQGWSQDAPALDPYPYLTGKAATAGPASGR